ncbi:MAG: DUF4340 domain-containing protein, partial [Deltaproteobacteria bacterium]
DELFDAIAGLRATGFVDEALSAAEAGLAPPALTLTLTPAAGAEADAPEPLRLQLGETRGDGKQLARGAEGALYEVASNTLAGFPPRRVVAYQWKELAAFDDAQAQGFEIVFTDPEAEPSPYVVTGENEDAGWTTRPDTLEGGQVFGMISELSKLRAREILAESMGDAELAALGLKPPRVTLRVFGETPEEGEPAVLAEVQLGRFDPKRGVPARAADRETVYRLSDNVGEVIPLSFEAYRNRFVTEPPEAEPADAAAADPSEEPLRED